MSDEVSDFLRSVEQLKDRRLEEDEARSRQLEEKILQEKRERQARRAERARSISPQKSSPANTPPPASHHHRLNNSVQTSDVGKLASSPPVLGTPRSPKNFSSNAAPTGSPSTKPGLSFPSSLPSKENEAPFDVASKTPVNLTPLTRTPTLSWQQRRPPSSSAGQPSQQPAADRPRSRPLSVVAAENAAVRSSTPAAEPELATANDVPVSRDQIAQALLAKDPSWFRQTPDRGRASAAYRRSQVEDDDRQDLTAASAQLHGLSRGPSAEPETKPKPSIGAGLSSSPAPSPFSPPPASAVLGPRPPTSASSARLGPSLPLTPTQTFEPPRDTLVSPLSGRTSPARSPTRSLSPTKGAGGFVQSAMMKRSDSVKRWSVTSPPGLQRADLIAAHRQTPTPNPLTKPSSRPTSSHGPSALSADSKAHDSRPSTPTRQGTPHEEQPKAAKEAEEAKEATEAKGTADEGEKNKTTPPLPESPTKTMDPRRWSPTKTSSWLDAALSKSEAPKPKTTLPHNNQPAWMVELNKAKAQKAGGAEAGAGEGVSDATRARAPSVVRKHEVRTGGLLRTTPMGATTGPPPTVVSAVPAAAASAVSAASPLTGRSSGLGSYHSPSVSVGSVGSTKAGGGAPVPSKPSTPPTSDFRASLKPRQPLPSEKKDGEDDGTEKAAGTGAGSGSGSGNELQSVVGALRRTKTQNYVAPDLLKDNILRGKSSLNTTGGPKPRERKDELKEAISQKKEQFQQAKAEGRGITTNAHARSDEAKPLPEGVAKRLEMSRTGGSRAETTAAPAAKPFGSVGRTPAPAPRLGAKASSSALASRFNPALAGILARGPPGSAPGGGDQAVADVSAHDASPAAPAASVAIDGPPGPGPQLTHMTKSRARGPRRKAPSSLLQAKTEAAETKPAAADASPLPSLRKSPPSLSPKRADMVAPRVVSSGTPAKKAGPPPLAAKPAVWTPPRRSASGDVAGRADGHSWPSPRATADPVDAAKADTFSTPLPHRARTFPPGQQAATVAAAAATTAATSAAAKSFPRSGNTEPASGAPAPSVAAAGTAEETTAAVSSRPSSPRKIDVKRMSKFLEESASQRAATGAPSLSSPAAEPLRRPLSPSKTGGGAARPLPEPRPLSPQKTGGNARALPTPPGMAMAKAAQALSPAPKPSSPKPALSPKPASPKPALSPKPASPKPSLSPKPALSPQPQKQQTPTGPRTVSTATPSSAAALSSPPVRTPTPSKQAQEASAVLRGFFGAQQAGDSTYRADTAGILARRPSAGEPVKTVKAQLLRLSSDGKTVPVARHLERVLFEGEMYLCPHTFTVGAAGWKRTEVYFWAGDAVPEAQVQDVQVFLGREARALGGPVVRLRQGKETAAFVQALGGVVLVRRGTSSKFDSLAAGVFCGRRFLGGQGVTFDEVDCAASSLCAGFPFLVTRQGRCTLWKGRGSHVDELSCARLMGMDLALMGELAEVDDGREPAAFWALFDGDGGRPSSAEHWRLKPRYDQYMARLFRSDAGSREQIVEIHPFHQSDLAPDGIYVLDAFFEMYIVVGQRAQTQFAAFRHALEFAQEYAILAASMEDRPFVPVATVVLEGVPRDLKSVFRVWRDAASPTTTLDNTPAPAVRRGRSLRIVPLTVALQALAE